jgi:hypothetical protein
MTGVRGCFGKRRSDELQLRRKRWKRYQLKSGHMDWIGLDWIGLEAQPLIIEIKKMVIG